VLVGLLCALQRLASVLPVQQAAYVELDSVKVPVEHEVAPRHSQVDLARVDQTRLSRPRTQDALRDLEVLLKVLHRLLELSPLIENDALCGQGLRLTRNAQIRFQVLHRLIIVPNALKRRRQRSARISLSLQVVEVRADPLVFVQVVDGPSGLGLRRRTSCRDGGTRRPPRRGPCSLLPPPVPCCGTDNDLGGV